MFTALPACRVRNTMGDPYMSRYVILTMILLAAVRVASAAESDDSRFTKTNSRSEYVHCGRSLRCGRQADPIRRPKRRLPIRLGTRAAAATTTTDRDRTPFQRDGQGDVCRTSRRAVIWTDERTGTQIPLSYRGWMGTYDPETLGISNRDFVLKLASPPRRAGRGSAGRGRKGGERGEGTKAPRLKRARSKSRQSVGSFRVC